MEEESVVEVELVLVVFDTRLFANDTKEMSDARDAAEGTIGTIKAIMRNEIRTRIRVRDALFTGQ